MYAIISGLAEKPQIIKKLLINYCLALLARMLMAPITWSIILNDTSIPHDVTINPD